MYGEDLQKQELLKSEFKSLVCYFVNTMKEKELGSEKNWVHDTAPQSSFFDIQPGKNRFFGQKIVIVSDDPVQIAFHGDIHGDVDSLIAFIEDLVEKGCLQKDNPFKINNKKKNFYLVFLGDYVDRGEYSFAVLYLLMRLKIANPGKVILLRGNHEDLLQNKISVASDAYMYMDNPKNMQIIYNLLPSFALIGAEDELGFAQYALFCHGGLEPRFNLHPILSCQKKRVFQWIDKLDISWLEKDYNYLKKEIVSCNSNFKKVIKNSEDIRKTGFIWSDFIIDDGKKFVETASGRGQDILSFGKRTTLALLKAYSCNNSFNGYGVKAVFTGHQHSDKKMKKILSNSKGLHNSWNNGYSLKLTDEFPVWTLHASPNGEDNKEGKIGHYTYDTYAVLNMKDEFKEWELKAFNLQTYKKSNKNLDKNFEKSSSPFSSFNPFE